MKKAIIFRNGLIERITEEVPPNEVALYVNYLLHRPVIKESSSATPIRPASDASARFQGQPSLNKFKEYHIEASKGFDCEFKKILKQSFYVDNVVASLDSYEDLNNFISRSTQLMLQGGFELRSWKSTGCKTQHGWETPVLGMKWNPQFDSLRVNISWINELSLEKMTKRIMLTIPLHP
ncbi:hypothetical protein AVEN_169344-1 [Araneus ventricosus]|uniref:Reverse transcriptase domain-containing protein n=1 Tax=Araneus ventricosus TaxID=182803 RepID=A0A4Y2VH03_ARAVE|nr:hypothetical protein AVEN_16924-1 [Araneus ventricosus]GBO23763.1 hypothetical protein AVEN_49070-1 [Araneus ventricosus]GBO23768.1 hypothetical protein AVEN_147161-1 [Araneus ventricosus]GBO23773.1 hypothetical protein AVEN_169344-1 [Araneus ventricosus]